MGAQDFIFKPNFPTSLTFETFNTLELHPAFLVKGKKLWDPCERELFWESFNVIVVGPLWKATFFLKSFNMKDTFLEKSFT